MNKAHPLSSHFDYLMEKMFPFTPCEDNEKIFGHEVLYISAIVALMFLVNCTGPDISFAINLLARYNFTPIKRHWVCVNTRKLISSLCVL